MRLRGLACLAVLLLATESCRVGAPAGEDRAQADRGVTTHQESVMQVTKPSDHEIVLTRTFTAPREAVFDALTQPAHLLHWMKAGDMAIVACEVDLRVGGTFRYVFQRANGRSIEVRGAYQAVDPPLRFAYEESYDFSPLRLLVTTVLEAAGDGTRFTQTLQYSSKQERDDDFDGVATSAAEAYARLERHLAPDGS